MNALIIDSCGPIRALFAKLLMGIGMEVTMSSDYNKVDNFDLIVTDKFNSALISTNTPVIIRSKGKNRKNIHYIEQIFEVSELYKIIENLTATQ